MAKIVIKNDSDQYIAFQSGVEVWMIGPGDSFSIVNLTKNSELLLNGPLYEKLLKKQAEFTEKIIRNNEND